MCAKRALVDQQGLKDLHDCLFVEGTTQDIDSVLGNVRGALVAAGVCTSQPNAPLAKNRDATHPEDLVLQAVGLIGDVLLCAIGACTVDAKKIKRLDRYVLPRLFLATSISSSQLCDIGLKKPRELLQQRRADISGDAALNDALQDWKMNYGCNFIVPSSAPTTEELHTHGSENPTRQSTSEPASGAVTQQRSPPAAWNSNLRQRAIPTLRKANPGIPSYMLCKRGSLPSLPTLPKESLLTTEEPLASDSREGPWVIDSEDSNGILAHATPVKQRMRVDASQYVLPSPDRTHRGAT